ncbi:K+-sensing histidine kinase KdpD [Litorivivens lipolytica]|uniref:histidine kinase n=1 Tax=Litorivivens lipolytica TaxID=1524264 RepID=A0A7W4W492_9GAMM|nr:hybrid sensor histidine kinase/response regulator [Litorivivens lipolytica]MBB3046858.1 K+-sensing histidine kinase KdpD [Litorivivens lipolytica]
MTDSGDEPLNLATDSIESVAVEERWTILVVDDEPDVHSVSRVVLDNQLFQGKTFELLDAYSAREAMDIMASRSDIAVVLLDVVMETDDAGLRVADYIRHELKNSDTRLIIRTGHPGNHSESAVAMHGSINYYEPKAALTSDRLFAIVCMAVDSYRLIRELKQAYSTLELVNADNRLFTDAIAHDIKSPARGISTLVDLLHDECSTVSNDAEELIGAMKKASSELNSLINSLLELARAGAQTLDVRACKTSSLIRDAVSTFMANHPEVVVSEEQHTDQPVFCDPALIQHVLLNVLENASKYQSEDRPLAINIASIHQHPTVTLTISDNGKGISEENIEKIFLPFKRDERTNNIEGYGIGLAVCKRIMQLHGGSIWAQPNSPYGTTLCLQLPTIRTA